MRAASLNLTTCHEATGVRADVVAGTGQLVGARRTGPIASTVESRGNIQIVDASVSSARRDDTDDLARIGRI